MYNQMLDDEEYATMPITGLYGNPFQNLPPEEQKLIDDYKKLMQRLNEEERERNKELQQLRIKKRAQEMVIQLKTLFQDPELRALAKELFQEAKAIRDDVQIDDRQSISK